MYNRYVPKSDGTYQKSRHPDRIPPQSSPSKPQQSAVCDNAAPQNAMCDTAEPKLPPRQPPCAHMRPPRKPPVPPKQESSGIGVGTFLRQLLPKNFDTDDLIVILLLLLMSSDCQEDQNSALLTLALYLFL